MTPQGINTIPPGKRVSLTIDDVVLGGDETRGELCERLGLDPVLVLNVAGATFEHMLNSHLAEAPSREAALRAALADLLLAGIVIGAREDR